MITIFSKKRKENLAQAIDKCQQTLQLNPNCISTLSELADIYERKIEFERAMGYHQQIVQLQPDSAVARARLAKTMMMAGYTQGAIANYCKAAALPNPPAIVYKEWGDILLKQGKVKEAIALYQKALYLGFTSADIYELLGDELARKGLLGKAIFYYFKAIQLEIFNLKYYQKITQISFKKIKLFKQKPKIKHSVSKSPQVLEAYLNIWQILNQTDFQELNNERYANLPNPDSKTLQKYFSQKSQYRIINLSQLNNEDEKFIENLGWSLSYLQ